MGGAAASGRSQDAATGICHREMARGSDVMDMRQRWRSLPAERRRVLIVAAAIEGIVKIAALRDLRRRPAAQVRGPKWLWAAVITLANSAGVVPAVYFGLGRRRS
jgi:hypothetical protein